MTIYWGTLLMQIISGVLLLVFFVLLIILFVKIIQALNIYIMKNK